jgi:hypothetical protein
MFSKGIWFGRVVGKRVESRHELGLDREELVHRRMRAGERVKDLREGGVGTTTEVGEDAGTFIRAEILKDLLLVRGGGMLRDDTEQLLSRSIRLNVGGPCKELTACSDELASLLVTPDSRPTTLGCLHKNRLVTLEAWDHESVKNLINRNLVIRGHDTNGAANLEVEDFLRRVIGNIEIEVEGSLLGTRLGELTSVVDLGRVHVVGRMRLDESRRLNGGIDTLIARTRNQIMILGRRGQRGRLRIGIKWDGWVRRRRSRPRNWCEKDSLLGHRNDASQVGRNLLKSKSEWLESIIVRQRNLLILNVISVAHTASTTTASAHVLSWCLTSDSLNVSGILSNQTCRCTTAALERDDWLFFLGVGIVWVG